MTTFFRDILVPVDFTVNTEVALMKAMELSRGGTTIHLLHVCTQLLDCLVTGVDVRLISNSTFSEDSTIEKQLRELKSLVKKFSDDIHVTTCILPKDKIQKLIELKAREIGADLVIIGKHSHHSWCPFLNTVFPGQILRNTGISVLTVKPGSMDNKIKTLVVPIYGKASSYKIDMILMISRNYNVRIHLVGFIDDRQDQQRSEQLSILQVYKQLKFSTHCQLEYVILPDRNKAKGILKYSESVDADMLLVYPGVETKIGWPNKYISDVLLPSSKIQILAVQSNY